MLIALKSYDICCNRPVSLLINPLNLVDHVKGKVDQAGRFFLAVCLLPSVHKRRLIFDIYFR